jgi:hypothetical protein
VRQVQVIVYCDPCQAWHEAETTEGVQTVPVAGGQTLDLCESHRSDLAPFLALVAEWGATPGSNHGARKPRSATQAPVAPAEPAQAGKRRGGKRARQRAANAAQRATEAPTVPERIQCPLCPTQVRALGSNMSSHLRHVHSQNVGTVYGTTCPLCGQAARTNHLGASHGIHGGGMPVAFHLAQAQGDPHGVVASRAAALAAP